MTRELINRAHLQVCSGGDLDFEQELLELYVTDTQNQLIVIEMAIAAGDWETVRQAAHQLKGSSSNLGIEPMQDLAAQLEQAAKQREQDKLATLGIELATAYAAVVRQVETWR